MSTLEDKYDLDEVPEEDKKYVKRLRRFLNDTAELNELKETEESSDLELYHALIGASTLMSSYNQPIMTFSAFSELPWAILKYGAVLEVLTMKGILSARNTLTYRDSGGVTVQNYDTYGRYINYFNILIRMFYNQLDSWKKQINLSIGFGGVPSEYQDLG